MTIPITTRSRLLSLSKGRQRFLKEIEGLFVKVLLLAREMGVLSLGTVALDGTKIHANASRHSALSYEHAAKLEAQLKAEVEKLLAKAEAADKADAPDGMSIPEELERREERLKKLAEARAKIEARASERFTRERAEYEAQIAAREAKTKASDKKPRGKPPSPPTAGPGPSDQINLTDEDSRIMPVAGGGFEQCYNAQAVVAADSLLVVAADLVRAANDKQQVEPMLGKLAALPADLGRPQTMLGDNGYFSAANVAACAAAAIEPVLALGRTPHHPSLDGALPRHRPHLRTRARSKPWRTAWPRPKARSFTLGESTPRSRCSVSSNRFSAFADSCCAGSTRSAASGAWRRWRGT
jgi:hypothetical protein